MSKHDPSQGLSNESQPGQTDASANPGARQSRARKAQAREAQAREHQAREDQVGTVQSRTVQPREDQAQPSPDPNSPEHFDLLGPLPRGTTLLEASAGTGKTYTIAALATRYIAQDGLAPDQLLLVTFGRSATRELRERVRASLVAARDALAGGDWDPDDEVISALIADKPSQRILYLSRLAEAIANFDAMSITTTHGFALAALHNLGIMAEGESDEVFVEDAVAVISQVVDDLYVRKYSRQAGPFELTHGQALDIGTRAVVDPYAELARSPQDPELAVTRTRLAATVRREVAKRLSDAHQVTFDDLITRLAQALADPITGTLAAARLRDRYQVVLVDEFQDTDPKQWEILRTAFHGHRTMILIGDPKQAIYAFRGADVFSYLQASSLVDHRATLGTNFRSDAAVVNGIMTLLSGMALGDTGIVVTPVAAHPRHSGSRIAGLPSSHRVRLRLVGQDRDRTPTIKAVRAEVAADVAADIAVLLAKAGLETTEGTRPLTAGDIAVLTSRNTQARLIRDVLAQSDIPAVINGTTSVFATPAAQSWLDLLEALEAPRPGIIRAVALGDFAGYSATELGIRGDEIADELAVSLRGWARTLINGSVAAMMAQIEVESELAARVLARPDGERALTDLRHIGALLHARRREVGAGANGLAIWLADRMRASRDSTRETASELTQRLETDAQAVQVLTIHRSKGLEFPVVYVPFGWDRPTPANAPEVVSFHDASGQRILDVRGHFPARNPHEQTAASEDAGEQLRLLYVALTRASSLVTAHWAASRYNTQASALHRILSARSRGSLEPAPRYPATHEPVKWLAGSAWVSVERVDARTVPTERAKSVVDPSELTAAPFDRTLDTSWRRTSFTALTSHGPDGPESAPESLRSDDDDANRQADPDRSTELAPVAPPTGDTTQTPNRLAQLPGGAAFGTVVHTILQDLPMNTPDLTQNLERACQAALDASPIPAVNKDDVVAGLTTALATPLGALAGGMSLTDIPATDRLDELEFELALAPGGQPASVRGIAALLAKHLPSNDPLRAYPAALITLPSASDLLNGYLVGAIDSVLRVPAPGGGAKYLVVDYKTNRLDQSQAPGRPYLAGYHPDELPAAMIRSHYPLQALLYCVALHRYLRWRLTDYDPSAHLGGVLYLYLRGMLGPQTPDGINYGVFSWAPPAELVVAISDLLSGSIK